MNSSLDFAHLMPWEDMSQAVHKLQPQLALLQATVADLQQQIADLQAKVELQASEVYNASIKRHNELVDCIHDHAQHIQDLQAKLDLQEQIAGVNFFNELAQKERKQYVDRLMREAMEGHS